MTPTAGDILAGKYRVERVLGMGGMGIVVAAAHIELRERRAIKLMRPEGIDSPESVERFLREARAAARLRSEHVAKVHDVGRLEDGAPFMVMEYLEGSDLNALLKLRRTLPIEEAVGYVIQACEALAEAHGAGIVHRDLKPANLFLTQDTDGSPCIKVLDFGISKASGPGTEGALGITRSDALLGSPLYMSPEQMRSPRDAETRSDIWSMGAILYKLVTGRAPFVADSILALFLVVMDKPPDPPSAHNPAITPELDAVILRCLEKDRASRYASVADFAAALLPFAPANARALVERIQRVFSAGPVSVAITSATLRSKSITPNAATLELGPVTPNAATLESPRASGPGPVTPNAATLESPRASGLEPEKQRGPSLDDWRDAGTKSGPPGVVLREEAQETSSGSWGNTRGGQKGLSRRRRFRLPIALVSAAGGAIVTAILLVLFMKPAFHAAAPEAAEPTIAAIAVVAAIAGRTLSAVPPGVSGESAPPATPDVAPPLALSGSPQAPTPTASPQATAPSTSLKALAPSASPRAPVPSTAPKALAPSASPRAPALSTSPQPPRSTATSAPLTRKPDLRSRTTF